MPSLAVCGKRLEDLSNAAVNGNGLRSQLWRDNCLALIDTGVKSVGIYLGQPPEGVFDDAGGVVPHTKLPILEGVWRKSMTVSTAIRAASSGGKWNSPVEIQQKATVWRLRSAASVKQER